jgi:autotransporter-associated beta strand protein
VDNVADGRVDLNLTAFDFPRWTGATNTNWDTATQNWREVNSGAATLYLQGAGGSDSVLFDDTATGSTNVNLASALTPSSVIVNNPTKNYTFSGTGKLAAITALLKLGGGRLTLANTGGNDYAGKTMVNAGTSSGRWTVLHPVPVNSAAAQLRITPSVIFDRPDNVDLSNVISGTGSVTKNNTNILTLLGNSTYTGATTVTAGTLRLGSATGLGRQSTRAPPSRTAQRWTSTVCSRRWVR